MVERFEQGRGIKPEGLTEGDKQRRKNELLPAENA